MNQKIPNDRPDYLKSELVPSDRTVLKTRVTVWLFALCLLAFYAFCATRAYAGEVGSESSVAAWKYLYSRDDNTGLMWRGGYIMGVIDAIATTTDGYTDEHATCVFNNFWPERNAHIGGVVEAVYATVVNMGFDPDTIGFADGLASTIYLTCMPELLNSEGTSAQSKWRST